LKKRKKGCDMNRTRQWRTWKEKRLRLEGKNGLTAWKSEETYEQAADTRLPPNRPY